MAAQHPFATRRYAEALAGPQGVVPVPEWGAHLIRRPIEAGLADAIGPYPLTVFRRGAEVGAGLDRLREAGLVSVVLVPDPLLSPGVSLARDFELCRPFKTHYLIDPASGPFAPSRHHRQELRRAARRGRVEAVRLADHVETWSALYTGLVARRAVSGAADFSPAYMQVLADDPAMQAFAAYADDAIVGMSIWFAAEGVVYYHLSAVDPAGYASGAAYALVEAAVAHFAGQGVIHLGGGAGTGDGGDGLAAFKRGFGNAEIMSHICGQVLDRAAYDRLSRGRGQSDFFPAYRAPVRVAA